MRELSCMRIISKVATLAAIAYKTSIGERPGSRPALGRCCGPMPVPASPALLCALTT